MQQVHRRRQDLARRGAGVQRTRGATGGQLQQSCDHVQAADSISESAGAILGHTTPRERRGAAEEK